MPRNPNIPKPYAEYPRRIWHPETGRWKDIKSAAEHTEGWLTRHPADPVHAAPTDEEIESGGGAGARPKPPEGNATAQMPVYGPEDRAEIIEALKKLGTPFSSRAATPALASLLETALAAR